MSRFNLDNSELELVCSEASNNIRRKKLFFFNIFNNEKI